MKSIRIRHVLITPLLMTALAINLQSQDCPAALESAERAYFSGQFEQAVEMTRTCLDQGGFDSTASAQALRLICLCYLAVDELPEARKGALQLLELAPGYEPDPDRDSRQFIDLIGSLRAGESGGLPAAGEAGDQSAANGGGSRTKWLLIGSAAVGTAAVILLLANGDEKGEFPLPPGRP